VTPQDPGSNSELGFSPESFEIRRNLEQYLMVFPTNFFPIMGQQVTITAVSVILLLAIMKMVTYMLVVVLLKPIRRPGKYWV
jgi:hypothetical protein